MMSYPRRKKEENDVFLYTRQPVMVTFRAIEEPTEQDDVISYDILIDGVVVGTDSASEAEWGTLHGSKAFGSPRKLVFAARDREETMLCLMGVIVPNEDVFTREAWKESLGDDFEDSVLEEWANLTILPIIRFARPARERLVPESLKSEALYLFARAQTGHVYKEQQKVIDQLLESI